MFKRLSLILLVFVVILSCRKDSFVTSPDASLRFSSDTVSFDTVFVAGNSPTMQLLVFNPSNQKLRIDDITLMGGAASAFNINVNGTSGPAVTEQVLEGGDSLYIFISANVAATAQQFIFALQDSIRLAFNGKSQFVQLRAWGRNAHFLSNYHINKDSSFSNDLPYVISGGLTVDKNATLTLLPGTQLYFHAGARLLVEGSLRALGEAGKTVEFNGDRLDAPYNRYPGSWPGLYFSETSKANTLQFTRILNADQAVVVQDPASDGNPKLSVTESVIDNASTAGLTGFQSSIYARNCLISNCGRNILLVAGGQYQFLQCTAVSYSTTVLLHQLPVLSVSDAGILGTATISSDLQALFSNCIFWGDANLTDEALIDKETSHSFVVQLDHSLLKQETYPPNVDSTALQLNADPVFAKVDAQERSFDFHLQLASPAVNSGRDNGITLDLEGNPRPVDLPDIGCYERQ